MRDLGEEDLIVLADFEQNPGVGEIRFEAIGDERLLVNGEQRRGYRAPENIVAGCYTRVDNRNGRICVGEEIDDEAPIDPVVTGTMSLPTFGSGGSSGFADDMDMMMRCPGGSDRNSNLSININADEAGPLLAHIVVKDGDITLRDVAIHMNGQMTAGFDVGDRQAVQVDVQFIDRAGNFGEITSIEVRAPTGGCEGCSHSGFGLFILLGLVGLRRRRLSA
jgi:hypothetical protein